VRPSILARRCRRTRAIIRSLTGSHFCAKAHALPFQSCTGWGLQDGTVTRPAGELLPRLSILTASKRGGISLLHYPWGRPRRTLSGTLPCGARTFLMRMTENSVPHATAWLTHKLYKLFYAYNILPQFSHSTMPSPVATRLTVLVGRDMLQPEHWLFSTFAIGTAYRPFMRL